MYFINLLEHINSLLKRVPFVGRYLIMSLSRYPCVAIVGLHSYSV